MSPKVGEIDGIEVSIKSSEHGNPFTLGIRATRSRSSSRPWALRAVDSHGSK